MGLMDMEDMEVMVAMVVMAAMVVMGAMLLVRATSFLAPSQDRCQAFTSKPTCNQSTLPTRRATLVTLDMLLLLSTLLPFSTSQCLPTKGMLAILLLFSPLLAIMVDMDTRLCTSCLVHLPSLLLLP